MLAGPVGQKPFPTHIHCNFKLHFNHNRFIKDTHYFSGDSYYTPNAWAGHVLWAYRAC